ncbi:MAG: diguanylate cyclase [Rhodocyclaceae bacterium]|jgi:diguanylate cyclase (GGDEF)-like protein|nr:diguanylate cyclase [Rhodocyclaceae bacterium]
MVPSFDVNKFEQMKASGDLPSPRGSALAIIRMIQEEDVSLAELARVIKTDPAFVGRLIKAANGLLPLDRRPVASIPEALMVLGLPAVRTMALGFSLLSSYRQGACVGFDYERYWSSSLLMALAMQLVTQRTRVAAPDEAFSVGLLARIGELALATMYVKGYEGVLAEHRSFPETRLADLERQAFAMDHRELSAAMLADWKFPRVFSQPVFYFEQPERAPYGAGSREYMVTHGLVLAAALAELCLAESVEQPRLLPGVVALANRIGLDRDVLTAMYDRLGKEWLEWGAILKLPAETLPPFSELAEAVANQTSEAVSADPVPAAGVQGEGPARVGLALRVLIVDDDASIRAVLRGVLERAGHKVFEAVHGRAGLEMALEIQPQLMIIDWMMPEMDGLELTRSLRKTKIGRTIYILLLTSLEEDDRLIEAFENGVDDFVTKPVKPRVLAARLRAGHRVIRLQQEIEKDREEIRHFAAELAVSNRRLQEVALTDSLTGFPNRRYAIERMTQEWAASQRSRRPLSCMVIDVDGFKQINDGYGHDVGDRVLVQASSALKLALRSQDVIARTGGDEFLVICPETSLEAAVVCAERLRKAVEGARLTADGVALGVTISVGVATRDGTMADPDALLKRADQGAYLAKQRGRNKVGTVQSIQKSVSPPGAAGSGG